MSLGVRILQGLIRCYQKTLSPDHGPLRYVRRQGACRFFPTCSDFMMEALTRYGVFRGCWHGLRRLIRCHPWVRGGFDPVP